MKSKARYKPGEKIGKNYLVHQTHLGGMGEVYLCLDILTNVPLALKTFQERFLSNINMQKLFEKEAEIWLDLKKHPNIVKCISMQILDNIPFLLLEWIVGDEKIGVSLRNYITYDRIDLLHKLNFAVDICRALIHANKTKQGFVHRDLKPENILITKDLVAKVTDLITL